MCAGMCICVSKMQAVHESEPIFMGQNTSPDLVGGHSVKAGESGNAEDNEPHCLFYKHKRLHLLSE